MNAVVLPPAENWDQDARTKQLMERIAVLEREARELTATPEASRLRELETTLQQVLEWLDLLVGETTDERLRGFCEGLAEKIRGVAFGQGDGEQT